MGPLVGALRTHPPLIGPSDAAASASVRPVSPAVGPDRVHQPHKSREPTRPKNSLHTLVSPTHWRRSREMLHRDTLSARSGQRTATWPGSSSPRKRLAEELEFLPFGLRHGHVAARHVPRPTDAHDNRCLFAGVPLDDMPLFALVTDVLAEQILKLHLSSLRRDVPGRVGGGCASDGAAGARPRRQRRDRLPAVTAARPQRCRTRSSAVRPGRQLVHGASGRCAYHLCRATARGRPGRGLSLRRRAIGGATLAPAGQQRPPRESPQRRARGRTADRPGRAPRRSGRGQRVRPPRDAGRTRRRSRAPRSTVALLRAPRAAPRRADVLHRCSPRRRLSGPPLARGETTRAPPRAV